MKSKFQKVIMARVLLVILLLVGFTSVAQVDQDKQGYFRHMVKSKETFYSLSRQYGVTIDEIKKANPGLDYPRVGEYLNIPGTISRKELPEPEFEIYTTNEEVSIYMLSRMLRFPFDSLRKWNPGLRTYLPSGKEIKTRPARPETRTITHTVVDDRSSLKDLATLYNVSSKTLKELNPQIKNRVWYGQKVKIPVLEKDAPYHDRLDVTGIIPVETIAEEELEVDLGKCRKDPRNLSQTYKVALLVPFSLEEVRHLDSLSKGSVQGMLNLPSFRFIQYYQGFILAADSLSSKGLNLELSVYDVDQDLQKVNALLAKREFKEMDMIIGPFYKNTFGEVAKFALDHSIPIINPLSARDDILRNNPYVFKVLPSRQSQIEELADFIAYRMEGYNTVIVTENKYKSADVVESIRGTLSDRFQRNIPVVDYMTDSIAGVNSFLSAVIPNLVIIYAETEVLPVEILPLLYEINKEFEVSVIGLPEWDQYEHLENKYLISLNAYLFSHSFIDYNEPEVKQFIWSFRSRFYTEPVEYAYDGFDAGYYFLSALMDYGKVFHDCAPVIDYPVMHTNFRFRQVPGGGYNNIYWNIYQYQDFFLRQVIIPR